MSRGDLCKMRVHLCMGHAEPYNNLWQTFEHSENTVINLLVCSKPSDIISASNEEIASQRSSCTGALISNEVYVLRRTNEHRPC